MEFYYYGASSTLEIADGTRTTTVELPKGLNPDVVAHLIQSDTVRTIIGQLTERERTL